jgi:HEAT repeat protein
MAAIEAPNADVTSALQSNLGANDRTLANASALALGIAALRLRTADDPRAAAIIDDLIARLTATTDPVAQIAILRALGNAGDPRSLPALRVALANSEPSVRKVAVEALRSIAEPTVDGLIAQVMLGDTDPDVRQGAVFASARRPIDTMLATLTRASADRDDDVRIEVAKALGNHHDNAGARSLLEGLAARDSVAEVREEARRQLAGA